MNNKIIRKLEEETERLIERLADHDPETNEYKVVASAISEICVTLNKEDETTLNLRKVDVELKKVDNDYVIRDRQIDADIVKDENTLLNNRELRQTQQFDNSADRDVQVETLNDSKLWNAAKISVEVVAIAAPLIFYGIWMNRGLKFEEEGSYTSQTFKGLIGKFKTT